ncbi:hypothetical protein GPL15_00675 [Clostridium sp. MCC353]|uniref:hypothetical protein n=1 Tax=Clostridium sp. MCC353 TaxID=2592646 RepID=UPI001C038B18|nr:hypothetical protein [Clostridium sp. MCC353]MBT9775022.1 hypothetical protein [Clostridium sp. MCC353]
MKKQVYGLLAAVSVMAALISGCGNKKADQETGQMTNAAQEETSGVTQDAAGVETKGRAEAGTEASDQAGTGTAETTGNGAAQIEQEDDPMYAVSGIGKKEADSFIQTLVSRLEAGEKAEAAKMIYYPRKVTVPDGDLIVDNAEEFMDYYDDIFTEDFIEKLKEDSKKELNYNYQGVWIGDGELWVMSVDDKLYVNSIFNADDRSVKYEGEPGVQPG